MKMNDTPKTITDLKYQDNVLHISSLQNQETEARRWFNEILGTTETVKVRSLFTEDNRTVYEAYVDSGSVDYLYIVK